MSKKNGGGTLSTESLARLSTRRPWITIGLCALVAAFVPFVLAAVSIAVALGLPPWWAKLSSSPSSSRT